MFVNVCAALFCVVYALVARLLFALFFCLAARAVELFEHPADVSEVFDGLPGVVFGRVALPLYEVNAFAV